MTKIDNKLKDFISKLYLYKALEGLVVFVLFFGIYFFVYLVAEYFLYLSSAVRTSLFYFSILLGVVFFTYKVIFPFLQSFISSLQISKENASRIIGSSDKRINDRLLNLLQLEKLGDDELVEESIRLLEKDLFQYDFVKSISLKNLVLLSKLTVLPILFFVLISLINFEGIVVKPTSRIVLFNKEFRKPLDFKIEILNDSLSNISGHDFLLRFKSNADLPLFIFVDDNIFEAEKYSEIYKHTFSNISENVDFRIGESFDKSYKFNLKTIYPPQIKSLELKVIPPTYTKLPKQTITNISDVEVAEGSKLIWGLHANNTEEVVFTEEKIYSRFVSINSDFSFSKIANKSFDYSITISNKLLKNYISLDYLLKTIPDAYPKIKVNTINYKLPTIGVYDFQLTASDDYGIKKYGYHIIKNNKVVSSKIFRTKSKNIKNDLLRIDTRDMDISGYFSLQFFVSDNDALHGSKTTYYQNFDISILSKDELDQANSALKDSLMSDYSNKLEDKIANDKLKEEFSKLENNDNNDLKELKTEIEHSIGEKEELVKNLNSINDKELLDEIKKAIDDQKKLLEEINEALKNQTKTKSEDADKLKEKNKFQQEKTLNLLRKIAASELLKSMSDDAKKLDDQIQNINSQPNNKTTDDIQKQLDKINKKLDSYSKLQNSDKLKNDLKQDMDNISKEAQKKSNSDLSKMKSSAKKMLNKLKQQSPNSMGGGESMSVDLEALNKLLFNYLELSTSQENLIREYKIFSSDDQIQQYTLLHYLSVLNSNLYKFAVENKYFTRASFDLIYPLLQYQEKFDNVYEINNIYTLKQTQREMLTNLNSVVDLLSDILEQMQNAKPNPSTGEGDGNDRKEGTPDDLIQQQKQLNSESQQNSDQPSEQGKNSNGSLSDEQISEIIKQQESIRNKYKELNGKNGDGVDKEVNEIKKLLLKKGSKVELAQHQQKILKHLKDLKGEQKDEEEKKRKSKSQSTIIINNNNTDLTRDLSKPKQEKLSRESLDFKEFYNKKIKK
jgi:hypothetical protein